MKQPHLSSPRLKAAGLLLLCSSMLALTGCPDKEEANQNPTITLDKQMSELTYTIGDTIVLTIFGQDPDGDGLTFEFDSKLDNDISTISTAMWFPTPQMATFQWTPDSADVTGDKPIELIFIVKDSRGGYIDRKVRLNIVPGNGVPRFEGSANELYKDCCDKALGLEIRVRDDDSESVDLQMTQGPKGAMFSTIGKDGSTTRGRFTWKPDATESKQRVHNAVFVANDGQNPPVEQRLTIIIPPDEDFGIDVRQDNALDAICGGDEIIEYTKLVPSRVNLPTDGDSNPNRNSVLIEAKLTDKGKQSYDELFLLLQLKDPLTNKETQGSACDTDPDSAACMMQKMDEGQSVQIKSTTDPTSGNAAWTVDYELFFELEERPLFYRVCAIDKDLNADDPNQIVCAPSGRPMFYSFRTYRDATAACIEEPAETFGAGNESIETATVPSTDVWERAFACEGNADFYRIEVKPGAKLRPSIVYSPDQKLDVKLYDENQTDISSQLNRPACGGIINTELELPMSAPTSKFYYLEVNGDEAVYHTQIIAITKAIEDACVDDANEPNDTVNNATAFTPGAAAQTYEMCTGDDIDIYSFDLSAGDQLDLMMRFDSAPANIADMTIFSPSQSDNISKGSNGSGFTFAFNNTEEPLSFTARQCGTHNLLVFVADSSSTGKYTLESTVSKSACQDGDEFSDKCNHSFGDAQLFALDQTYPLELCGKSEDWLRRSGSGGVDILGEVAVTSGDASAVIFEIYNANGELVAEGESDGDSVSLDYTIPDNDFYYFRIASSSDEPITYELLVIQ